jgi:ABC-type sugar transport system ATPase subunit
LASDWIARLGIRAPNVDAPVQTLSGGNQQRLCWRSGWRPIPRS